MHVVHIVLLDATTRFINLYALYMYIFPIPNNGLKTVNSIANQHHASAIMLLIPKHIIICDMIAYNLIKFDQRPLGNFTPIV